MTGALDVGFRVCLNEYLCLSQLEMFGRKAVEWRDTGWLAG